MKTQTLLLDNNETREFKEWDVVRFADGDTHGITNSSEKEFIYTSPPVNFRYACKTENGE